MRKSILTLSALILSLTSYAGNERGNGGDAVVCRDTKGNIRSAELLDFYEGRNVRGLSPRPDFGVNNEVYLNSLSKVLFEFDQKIFGDFNKESSKINKAVQEFLKSGVTSVKDVVFTTEELTDIPDSGNLLLKPGCNIEQLAIRVNKTFEDDPSYIIQSNILKALSKRDLLGLVLHEAVYRAFVINLKAQDSVAARYFNQKISSKDMKEIVFWDYLEVAKKLKPNLLEIQRGMLRFSADSAEKLSNGSVKMWETESDLILVFNSNGKLDLEQSRIHGGVRTIPYWKMFNFGATMIEGLITVYSNNKKAAEWKMPWGGYQSNVIPFGEWKVALKLTKMAYPNPLLNFGLDYEFKRSSDGKPLLINATDDEHSGRDYYAQNATAYLNKNFELELKNVNIE